MKVNLSLLKLKKICEISHSRYTLNIYGYTYFLSPEEIDFSKAEEDPSILNLDGEYFLIYTNKVNGKQILFRSHVDSFSIFYFVQDDYIYFTDDLFTALTCFDAVTWNLRALSDYFEVGWNNIQKNDHTPFIEIKKLPAGSYVLLSSHLGMEQIQIESWKKPFYQPTQYTMKNLDEFKVEYLATIKYYLQKIVEDNTSFTVGGGIDSGTLAALSTKLFPERRLSFYSTRLNDANDEAFLTNELNAVLSDSIKFMDIDCPSDFIKNLKELIHITQCPYSDIEGITHIDFFKKLQRDNVSKVITGFGADLTFGGTPYEYPGLIKKFLKRGYIIKAFHVFIAYKCGIGEQYASQIQALKAFFYEYILNRLKRLAQKLVNSPSNPSMRYRFTKGKEKSFMNKVDNKHENLLLVDLPEKLSRKIKTYEDGLQYACTDSALRQLSAIQRSCHMSPFCPFEGFKFLELSSKCDQYIYANMVNKFCLRYSVEDILPDKIIQNKQKFGNGGYEEELINKNRDGIILYLKKVKEAGWESIVNIDLLMQKFQNKQFSDDMFRCLNIIVYEEILRNELNLNMNVAQTNF